MAKRAEDVTLDALGDFIIANGQRQIVCSAEPTTYAEANATYALADVAMAGGDYSKANGDTNGRKLTMAAKAAVAVDVTGTGNHVAIVDDTNTRLLYVTTAPAQGVSSGGTVDIGTWDIETADPV